MTGKVVKDLREFIVALKEEMPGMSPALLRERDIYPWLWSLQDQLKTAISEGQTGETVEDTKSE